MVKNGVYGGRLLRKIIVLRIPFGRGDQLLPLFESVKGGFSGPFWGSELGTAWVNEINLRLITLLFIFVKCAANLFFVDSMSKKFFFS